MNWLDRLAYTVICWMIGLIMGASWVLSELGPRIDLLTKDLDKADRVTSILKIDNEIMRVKYGIVDKKTGRVGNKKVDSRVSPAPGPDQKTGK